MPLYNFQKLFAAAVKSGTKRRTLRNPRKRPTKVTDTLYMYSGLRTKHSEKIGVFKCSAVSLIKVTGKSISIKKISGDYTSMKLRSEIELNNFAQLDGFPDFETMKRWITKVHGSLPWHCDMIEW